MVHSERKNSEIDPLADTETKESFEEHKGKTLEEKPLERSARWEPPELPKFLRVSLIILANTITFLNFASGVTAIVLVIIDPQSVSYTLWAARLVLLAIIFDFADGIPARLAKKDPGFFGTVVDSVADTFSFGLAPGVMIALSFPVELRALSILSIIVGGYFAFCALFRLVRFTKMPSKKWFKGIPAPGAGCVVALYIMIKLYIEQYSSSIITPIFGLIMMTLTATMMIVTLRYPTTKLRKNILEIILLGLTAVLIVALAFVPLTFLIYPAGVLAILTCVYVFYGPFYLIKHMLDRAKEVENESKEE